MSLALLVDFGSTYTKAVAVDLAVPAILGQAYGLTTVESDITLGLHSALVALERETGRRLADFEYKLACSSAAGGLRMVAVGLVPEMTAAAARQAALGAGARVTKVYSYELSPADQAELASLPCDLLLLAGGTDGGDRKTILHNARVLAGTDLAAVVIVAGNRAVAKEAAAILQAGGKESRVTENVLPSIRQLRIEPAREAIRQLFMEKIVTGKGFKRAETFLGGILMPTPAAVLSGAELMADGVPGSPGLGDLLVVDIGGATTDVHSVALGQPTRPGTIIRGLPEPYAKRTVEGDLGLRVSAASLFAAVGAGRLAELLPSPVDDIEARVSMLAAAVGSVPQSAADADLDRAMATAAVELAVERHAGVYEMMLTPAGTVYLQTGKDLSRVSRVVGTGGVFAHLDGTAGIIRAAVASAAKPHRLLPQAPELWVDRSYILWAMGLLRSVAPGPALALLQRCLVPAD